MNEKERTLKKRFQKFHLNDFSKKTIRFAARLFDTLEYVLT